MSKVKIKERIDIGKLLTEEQAIDYINKRIIDKKWESEGAYINTNGISDMKRKVTLFKMVFIEEKGKYSEKKLDDFLNASFAKSTILPYCKRE